MQANYYGIIGKLQNSSAGISFMETAIETKNSYLPAVIS